MDIDQLIGKPTSVRIAEVIDESVNIRTLKFQYPFGDSLFHPGQFMMIWVPGVDEIPMSISFWEPPYAGVTVAPIGEATNTLATLQSGKSIGVRGPFGSAFPTDSKAPLIVGGGIGMAPLRPLTYHLLEGGANVTLLIAAKKKDELVYLSEFESIQDSNLILKVSTDDGSMGYKGFATGAVSELLSEQSYDMLYTCGPELMMSGLFELAKSRELPFQASLERFMKCGCGICGTCSLDPTGDLVCLEGPVFSGEHLSKITEFGKYHRDSMGLKKQC